MSRNGSQRTAADQRTVLCSLAGTFAPSGERVGPAVDSVERLARMLAWAADSGRLTADGTIAQVWVVGATAVDMLGWLVDAGVADEATPIDDLRDAARARLTAAVAADLPTLERGGWRARDGWESGGAWVRLERIAPGARRGGRGTNTAPPVRVDVILEPFAWTTPAPSGDENLGILGDDAAGWGLPEDEDAARAELGRRLSWCVEHLHTLPAVTPSRTGAAIARAAWSAADRHRLTEPVPLPPLAHPPRGDLEPAVVWSVDEVDPAALAAADRLVVLDQRAAYLASVAAVPMPIGPPRHVADEADLNAALWWSDVPAAKWPPGVWTAMFPAAVDVPEWRTMPPIHADWWRVARREPTTAPMLTATTETFAALASEWQGGPGLEWCREHVALVEGWVWDDSIRPYQRWQEILREAYKTAVRTEDRAMKTFVGRVYKSYIGALGNRPDQWGRWRAMHSQPVGQAAVHAHAHWRGRRKVTNIGKQFGLYPLTQRSDAFGYLVPRGMDVSVLADDDTDGKLTLGKLLVERWCELADDARARLADARGPEQVAEAFAYAFRVSPRVEVCK